MRLFNHPVLCNYYITYRCNASCSFCDIWEKPSPYVTPEQVRENLAALKRLKVRVIDFTGGEPLLHRQLPELLRIAREHRFITTVTTNTLLYPKYGEGLRGLVDMLHFSLDSIVREKHNASRKVNCYDHLLESVQLAKSWGEKPDILFTVTDENVHEIAEVIERFVHQEKLMVILNPMFAYNSVGKDIADNTLRELRRWTRTPGVYLNEAFLRLREEGGNHTTQPVCRAGSSTVVITPENELIVPCYHLGTKSFQIQRPLDELYRSADVQAIVQQEGKLPGCEGCTVNCYMEPSMAVETGRYFRSSLPSTVKYALEKWVY